ncbi:hypothetical protein GGI25_002871 [Coemansia spiralis]|uniref:Uncharacterized protein n=2 Tax=Coemansia TaxID=4863 RepID=A0A9W8G321_9FUNG|nr:transferase [Coemansia spiralis]KAJ1992343.1 hypothetical protein EDC05_002841 [Coemansia umbellata]KAJ2622274.1 hypothetical protein GGI26_003427 [Coemansia sp. RSA 1358]KAJ2677773.1 hypothetical protein GGI25_002871 [Coemansia spiralis]
MPSEISTVVDLLPFEKFFRAYISYFWFYSFNKNRTVSSVVEAIQKGVDRTVQAMPVLSGVLKEDKQTGHVYITYNCSRTLVSLAHATETLEELEKSNYNQNTCKIFVEQKLELTNLPGINNIPVLQVQVIELGCGSLCVCIMCHHVAMDGAATAYVAESIGRASRGLGVCAIECNRMWLNKLLHGLQPQETPGNRHIRRLGKLAANVVNMEETRRHQIGIDLQGVGRLKQLDPECSTNTLVMALMWRTWTRTLVELGSRSEFTYLGWPIDMRTHAGQPNYLGNLFLPYMGYETKHFVLNEPLPVVAQRLRDFTQRTSLQELSGYNQSVINCDSDTRSILEQSDSPALSFSNTTRMPIDQVDFGLGALQSVQMLHIDAPIMMFAISSGRNILINVVMPQRVAKLFKADAEFSLFARFLY